MARGKLFSEFECDVIRVGLVSRHTYAQIARFLGRTPAGVAQMAKRMERAGTLGNMPFDFVRDDVAEQIAGAVAHNG